MEVSMICVLNKQWGCQLPSVQEIKNKYVLSDSYRNQARKLRRFKKLPAKISLPLGWMEEIFSSLNLDSVETPGHAKKKKKRIERRKNGIINNAVSINLGSSLNSLKPKEQA
jgi:hypothetical protein